MQCNAMRDTATDKKRRGELSEGLGVVLERQSHAQVRKDILLICTHTRDHALTSHTIIVIATLAIPVALIDVTVAQHSRPGVCREVLNKYSR